jgi:CheY-like chemotaxis protein
MFRILVVDDDPVFLTLATQELVNAGHSALIADSAPAALKPLHAGEPVALVMIDLLMPSGIELILILRLAYPMLPIIALSTGGSWPDAMLLTTAQTLGADSVLRKPIRPGLIGETIAALLRPVQVSHAAEPVPAG